MTRRQQLAAFLSDLAWTLALAVLAAVVLFGSLALFRAVLANGAVR